MIEPAASSYSRQRQDRQAGRVGGGRPGGRGGFALAQVELPPLAPATAVISPLAFASPTAGRVPATAPSARPSPRRGRTPAGGGRPLGPFLGRVAQVSFEFSHAIGSGGSRYGPSPAGFLYAHVPRDRERREVPLHHLERHGVPVVGGCRRPAPLGVDVPVPLDSRRTSRRNSGRPVGADVPLQLAKPAKSAASGSWPCRSGVRTAGSSACTIEIAPAPPGRGSRCPAYWSDSRAEGPALAGRRPVSECLSGERPARRTTAACGRAGGVGLATRPVSGRRAQDFAAPVPSAGGRRPRGSRGRTPPGRRRHRGSWTWLHADDSFRVARAMSIGSNPDAIG